MSKSQSIEIPVSDFHLKRNCGNKINLLPIFFGEFFFAQPSQLLLFLNSLLLSFDCRRWRRANSPNNTLSKLAKRQSDQRDANPCKESRVERKEESNWKVVGLSQSALVISLLN